MRNIQWGCQCPFWIWCSSRSKLEAMPSNHNICRTAWPVDVTGENLDLQAGSTGKTVLVTPVTGLYLIYGSLLCHSTAFQWARARFVFAERRLLFFSCRYILYVYKNKKATLPKAYRTFKWWQGCVVKYEPPEWNSMNALGLSGSYPVSGRFSYVKCFDGTIISGCFWLHKLLMCFGNNMAAAALCVERGVFQSACTCFGAVDFCRLRVYCF